MSESHVVSIDTESTGTVTPTTSNGTNIGSASYDKDDAEKSVASTGTSKRKDSSSTSIQMDLDPLHIKYLKKKGISLNEPLATGTFSQVYKISAKKHSKAVAMKIIKIKNTKSERFRFLKREIKAVRGSTRSGIVKLHCLQVLKYGIYSYGSHREWNHP